MKLLLAFLMVIVLAVSLMLSACTQSTPGSTQTPAKSSQAPAAAATQQSWSKLTFMTAPSGTNPHTTAVAWSTLANKYLPGMQITVEPAVGAPQAVIGFLQGQGDITYDSSNIVGPEIPKYFGGKTLTSGPYHLVTATTTAVHIVTKADSGITSVADFKGRKILGRVATGAGVDLARQKILSTYGLTDSDINLLTGNNASHLSDQLKEGVGDAAMIFIGLGDPALIDLCTAKDIRWISLPNDKMESIAGVVWMVPGVIPAGTYPKQAQAVTALLSPGSFDVRPSMSEDVAYALTKLFFDHFDEFTKMSPWAKGFKIETTLSTAYLPFHPGAIKYYKEKGVWTPDAEARQQKLLSQTIPMPPPPVSPPAK